MPATIKRGKKNADIIINELNIRSVDRGRKDIATWNGALRSAESVYYPNRSRLYDLYADVMLDGHLSGIISKRIDAVLNKTIYFEKDGRKIYELDKLTGSIAFRSIMRTIMQTVLWGISGIEFLPGKELNFQAIPRKHIMPNLGIIAFEQGGNDGIAYNDLNNVWIMGEPDDLGLLLKCAPYYLYKRGGMSDWAEYLQLFGQPVRIIKYDSYDEQTKTELKSILETSGSSLAIMLPRQADFEMKDGKQANSDGDLQLSFLKLMNEEMSVLVLGNTETTVSSKSSGYAQSQVHLQEQHEITKSDIRYMANMLNNPEFLDILYSYGYPVRGGSFTFAPDLDMDYLQSRLAVDKEVATKVAISNDYWYDTYGIPKPV